MRYSHSDSSFLQGLLRRILLRVLLVISSKYLDFQVAHHGLDFVLKTINNVRVAFPHRI